MVFICDSSSGEVESMRRGLLSDSLARSVNSRLSRNLVPQIKWRAWIKKTLMTDSGLCMHAHSQTCVPSLPNVNVHTHTHRRARTHTHTHSGMGAGEEEKEHLFQEAWNWMDEVTAFIKRQQYREYFPRKSMAASRSGPGVRMKLLLLHSAPGASSWLLWNACAPHMLAVVLCLPGSQINFVFTMSSFSFCNQPPSGQLGP